jgi:hypothetical protein
MLTRAAHHRPDGHTCTRMVPDRRARLFQAWTPAAVTVRQRRVAGRRARLNPPLPLARVAAAVEAGNDVQRVIHRPKVQRVRKAPAPSTANISVDDGKLLGGCGNPSENVLDFGDEAIDQFCTTSAVPIARFDQFRSCSGGEDDRRQAQRRCRSSSLSWSHGMLCCRS